MKYKYPPYIRKLCKENNYKLDYGNMTIYFSEEYLTLEYCIKLLHFVEDKNQAEWQYNDKFLPIFEFRTEKYNKIRLVYYFDLLDRMVLIGDYIEDSKDDDGVYFTSIRWKCQDLMKFIMIGEKRLYREYKIKDILGEK